MRLEGELTLLRVVLRNTDKHSWFSAPAAEELVRRARKEGMAGATVLRGIYGLDITGKLLQGSGWSLADHVPVVVEIVDGPQRIGRFLTTVAEVVREGIATLERARVMLYRHPHGESGRDRLSTRVPAGIPDLSTVPTPEEFPAMQMSEDGQLLRIFIGESDQWQGTPLYRAVVLKAKELDLAGATVLRGPMSFGANSRLHTTKLLELSGDLPIIIEIVDSAAKIETLLPFLDEVVQEGMITIEAVRVLRYRQNAAKSG
jgi:hypothetical protein